MPITRSMVSVVLHEEMFSQPEKQNQGRNINTKYAITLWDKVWKSDYFFLINGYSREIYDAYIVSFLR